MDHIPPMKAVMTSFPHFVNVGDSLLLARQVMVEHEVRHLPVKDEHRLVGILTDRDLKRALDPDLGLPPKEELLAGIFTATDACRLLRDHLRSLFRPRPGDAAA
jgi:CBS domain-containing protein